MERFAIKIDERVKLNLYNICRLCGIDNRDQVPIIDEPDSTFAIEDEPSLCKKIHDCVGIQVDGADKMPQKICTLCVDKINDFYEYREMCKATNLQTRELLGLPPEIKDEKPLANQQPFFELPAQPMKRKRKLKSECINYEEIDDDEIDEKPPKRKFPKSIGAKNAVGAKAKKNIPARRILVKRETAKEKAIPVLKEKPSATVVHKEKQIVKEKVGGATVKEKVPIVKEKIGVIKEKLSPSKEKLQYGKEKLLLAKEDPHLLQPVKDKIHHQSKLPIARPGRPLGCKDKTTTREKSVSIVEDTIETGSSKVDTDLITLKTPNRRERQRELESKKKRKVGTVQPLEKVKTENLFACIVCPKDFKSQSDYDIHFFREHTPNTLEHGCSACREAFYDLQEYRDHQLWHRLSSIPFSCFKCNSNFDRVTAYTRHFLTSCVPPNDFTNVDDIKCAKCQKIFLTKNLYEWHGCLIKNNSNCPRCQKFFAKRIALQKHVVMCNDKPVDTPLAIPNVSSKFRLKSPTTTGSLGSSVDGKKIVKIEPGSILEIENESHVQVPHDEEHELDDSVTADIGFQDEHDQDEDDEEDASGNRSTELDNSTALLDKSNTDACSIASDSAAMQVRPIKQEKVDRRYDEIVTRASTANIPMVQIKQENLNSDYSDHVDQNILRNIKPEPVDNALQPNNSKNDTNISLLENSTNQGANAKTAPPKPTLKLKIKKEHGTLNSSFIDSDFGEGGDSSPNPTRSNDDESAGSGSHHRKKRNKHKKKIYKIPKQLALIIKQEKQSRSEDHDEHTSNPEDEHVEEAMITVPVISEVASIAENTIESENENLPSDYYERNVSENPPFTVCFPSHSRTISENISMPVAEIQMPVISEVISLKEIEPRIPLISSVTSLSQAAGIRVKMEFNNFASPQRETIKDAIDPRNEQDDHRIEAPSRIDQDNLISGNYHTELDSSIREKPDEHLANNVDEISGSISPSTEDNESEIEQKPNVEDLMKITESILQPEPTSTENIPQGTNTTVEIEPSTEIRDSELQCTNIDEAKVGMDTATDNVNKIPQDGSIAVSQMPTDKIGENKDSDNRAGFERENYEPKTTETQIDPVVTESYSNPVSVESITEAGGAQCDSIEVNEPARDKINESSTTSPIEEHTESEELNQMEIDTLPIQQNLVTEPVDLSENSPSPIPTVQCNADDRTEVENRQIDSIEMAYAATTKRQLEDDDFEESSSKIQRLSKQPQDCWESQNETINRDITNEVHENISWVSPAGNVASEVGPLENMVSEKNRATREEEDVYKLPQGIVESGNMFTTIEENVKNSSNNSIEPNEESGLGMSRTDNSGTDRESCSSIAIDTAVIEADNLLSTQMVSEVFTTNLEQVTNKELELDEIKLSSEVILTSSVEETSENLEINMEDQEARQELAHELETIGNLTSELNTDIKEEHTELCDSTQSSEIYNEEIESNDELEKSKEMSVGSECETEAHKEFESDAADLNKPTKSGAYTRPLEEDANLEFNTDTPSNESFSSVHTADEDINVNVQPSDEISAESRTSTEMEQEIDADENNMKDQLIEHRESYIDAVSHQNNPQMEIVHQLDIHDGTKVDCASEKDDEGENLIEPEQNTERKLTEELDSHTRTDNINIEQEMEDELVDNPESYSATVSHQNNPQMEIDHQSAIHDGTKVDCTSENADDGENLIIEAEDYTESKMTEELDSHTRIDNINIEQEMEDELIDNPEPYSATVSHKNNPQMEIDHQLDIHDDTNEDCVSENADESENNLIEPEDYTESKLTEELDTHTQTDNINIEQEMEDELIDNPEPSYSDTVSHQNNPQMESDHQTGIHDSSKVDCVCENADESDNLFEPEHYIENKLTEELDSHTRTDNINIEKEMEDELIDNPEPYNDTVTNQINRQMEIDTQSGIHDDTNVYCASENISDVQSQTNSDDDKSEIEITDEEESMDVKEQQTNVFDNAAVQQDVTLSHEDINANSESSSGSSSSSNESNNVAVQSTFQFDNVDFKTESNANFESSSVTNVDKIDFTTIRTNIETPAVDGQVDYQYVAAEHCMQHDEISQISDGSFDSETNNLTSISNVLIKVDDVIVSDLNEENKVDQPLLDGNVNQSASLNVSEEVRLQESMQSTNDQTSDIVKPETSCTVIPIMATTHNVSSCDNAVAQYEEYLNTVGTFSLSKSSSCSSIPENSSNKTILQSDVRKADAVIPATSAKCMDVEEENYLDEISDDDSKFDNISEPKEISCAAPSTSDNIVTSENLTSSLDLIETNPSHSISTARIEDKDDDIDSDLEKELLEENDMSSSLPLHDSLDQHK